MRSIGRRSILGVFLIIAFISVTLSGNVFAAEKNDNLKTVRVGYLNYEGFQEGVGKEPKSGYGYEYLQQIAYFSGWKYQYVNGTFNNLLEMLKKGEIDIMGNISYTEERAKYIDYAAEEQGREYYYLFIREDKTDISASDFSTLNGTKIGVNKGSVQADLFKDWCKENNVKCDIISYDSSSLRYKDMNDGVLDGTISTNVASTDIKRYRWNAIIKVGSSPYYFATNKKRPDLLEDLNEANYKIHQSDWYYNEKVYLKYYGKTSASVAGLSKEDLEWLKKQKTIMVGYMDNTLPYSDKDDETGELRGLLPAFMDTMKKRYGVEFETKEFSSYEQMKNALYDGEIDTMFPTYGSYWVAEENNMMVTDALTTSQVLMLYSGNYGDDVASMIAITDESPTQQFYVKEHFYAKQNYGKTEILTCDSMEDCIRAVLSGKASCTLMSSDLYYANRNKFDDLGDFIISNTGYDTSVGFATKKDNIEMYSFMRKCVASMTEAEINEAMLASRYESSEQSIMEFLKKHILMVLSILIFILLLIIAFFAYYTVSSRKTLQLAKNNCELNEKAYIDFATGLPNKNRCEEMLSSPFAITRPTTCFMLDLNDLKIVNDTLGHEMGDLMILNFAKLLRQTVPLKFFVGRFGGDEFIVIAEDIGGEAESEQLEKKIREIILKFNGNNGAFKLSYACGFAFSGEFPSCSIKELLDIADQRMYENKKKIKSLKREEKNYSLERANEYE
ncbi:MAG: diguanylate cyclase domain-containing protein [Lachnospiraceae bacterium]